MFKHQVVTVIEKEKINDNERHETFKVFVQPSSFLSIMFLSSCDIIYIFLFPLILLTDDNSYVLGSCAVSRATMLLSSPHRESGDNRP